MLKRSAVVMMSFSMIPSASASLYKGPRAGQSHWHELSAERIHCGANHGNRKTRLAYEKSKSSRVKSSVAYSKKSSGVRAQ